MCLYASKMLMYVSADHSFYDIIVILSLHTVFVSSIWAHWFFNGVKLPAALKLIVLGIVSEKELLL